MIGEPVLVTIELRFKTTDDPKQLGDRIRESVRMIVGGDGPEEFRVRAMPLAPPKKPQAV